MLKHCLKLASLLCAMLAGLSSSQALASLLYKAAEEAAELTGEKQYVAMEDITAEMMQMQIEMNGAAGGGGLRGLQSECDGVQQWTCEKGSNPDLVMTFAGRVWGSCVDMDPCLCGLMPLQMAYWCPKECRVDCNGTCATPEDCPNGYAIENGTVVVLDYPLPPPPWPEWICPLGTACPTPMPTPAPTQVPTSTPTVDTRGIPAPTETREPTIDLSPIWNLGG